MHGGPVPFKLNAEQQILLQALNDSTTSVPHNVVTKPRQCGVTSLVLAYALREALTKADQMIVLMGRTAGVRDHMRSIVRHMSDTSLFKTIIHHTSRYVVDFDTGSRIMYAHIDPTVGKGMNLSFVYVDELDSNPDANLDFWDSIRFQGVNGRPGKIVLASTPMGLSPLFTLAKASPILFTHTDLTLAASPIVTPMIQSTVIDAYDRAMKGL